jgi:hypothetical protein
MDSVQLIRGSFSLGSPAESASPKPLNLDPPIDAAAWRFLLSWQDHGKLGADEAVLFRQAYLARR